jgi:ribokinase
MHAAQHVTFNACDVPCSEGLTAVNVVAENGDVVEQQAMQVKHVVDTTGAGDCFTASFAVAKLRGLEVKEALAFASVAAALCVQSVGAMSSMPSAAQVQAGSL